MTVIVATKRAMYADSRCTFGSTHFPTPKIFRDGKTLIGCAGNNSGIEKFLAWLKSDRSRPIALEKGDRFEALVLSKKGLYVYGNSSLPDLVAREWHAVGCGAPVAIGALAMGADARKAVEIACEHADGCGPPVQEFTL